MAKRAFFVVLGLGLSLAARSQGILWSNVSIYPDDLMTTGDGWSATRADDIGSLRCAADDVTFVTKVRISRMTYYSVQVGEPDILGGDIYVYAWDNGKPGNLIAALPDLPIEHADSGWFNTVFQSNVYTNVLRPDLELQPGQYFIAFRTVENRAGGAKNGALTTRTAIGDAPAQWNFNVQLDGTVGGEWVSMEQFNLVPDQEWSFLLHGDALYNPTSFNINLGQLRFGNVNSLREDEGDALRICRFIVPNQQVAPVTVELNGAALSPFVSTLRFELLSKMVSAGAFSQTIEMWDWDAGDWDPTDTRNDAIGSTYANHEVAGTGDLGRYLRDADNALKARYLVRSTGPTAVQVWCHEVDHAAWAIGS